MKNLKKLSRENMRIITGGASTCPITSDYCCVQCNSGKSCYCGNNACSQARALCAA